eukprot:14430023-Alexandrium_andersonii.AAC.1
MAAPGSPGSNEKGHQAPTDTHTHTNIHTNAHSDTHTHTDSETALPQAPFSLSQHAESRDGSRSKST